MRLTEISPRALGMAVWLWAAVGTVSAGQGQPAEPIPRVELRAPAELYVGELVRFEIVVQLPPGAAEPLLVTPYRDGEALEIVKGRLLRSDARDPNADPLTFELPVLARAHGSAVVGVRLLAYVCEAKCRAVEVVAQKTVVVLPRYSDEAPR